MRYKAQRSSSEGVYSVVDTRWNMPLRWYDFDKELAEYICEYLNRRADAPTEGKEESEDESAPARTPKDRAAN